MKRNDLGIGFKSKTGYIRLCPMCGWLLHGTERDGEVQRANCPRCGWTYDRSRSITPYGGRVFR